MQRKTNMTVNFKQQPGKPCGVFTIARAMEDNRISPILSEFGM
jgi:hypothetical protein